LTYYKDDISIINIFEPFRHTYSGLAHRSGHPAINWRLLSVAPMGLIHSRRDDR